MVATSGCLIVSNSLAVATPPSLPPLPVMEGVSIDLSITEVGEDVGLYLITATMQLPDSVPVGACSLVIIGVWPKKGSETDWVKLSTFDSPGPAYQVLNLNSPNTATILVRVFGGRQSLWQWIRGKEEIGVTCRVTGSRSYYGYGPGAKRRTFGCWQARKSATFEVRPIDIEDLYQIGKRDERNRSNGFIRLSKMIHTGIPDSIYEMPGLWRKPLGPLPEPVVDDE